MRVRLLALWERVRSSLWFVPAALSAGATALALGAARLDALLAASGPGGALVFLYAGDQQGARTLLSTVAGSMITVAGVTFSITMVALTLASSQLGPRLLVNFMRDRGNQLVLGTFIATFLFCMVALGAGPTPEQPDGVPAVSASVGLLLAVASVAVLIYFIHHASTSINAEHVIEVVARELEVAVDRLVADDAPSREDPVPDLPDGADVPAPVSGYVRAVDERGLVELAAEQAAVLHALRRPGHFVVAGEPLLRVAGRAELEAERSDALAGCFLIGRSRTHDQDPEYGVHQLVEIAVRALSPGVNDPYTALSCVDWLGSILCRLGGLRLRPARRTDAEGRVRLWVDPLRFEGMLASAFDQVRQFAGSVPAVSIRLLETLTRIARQVERPERREALRAQADMVHAAARGAGLGWKDREDLEQRYAECRAALGDDPVA